jgi:hypothetical protein
MKWLHMGGVGAIPQRPASPPLASDTGEAAATEDEVRADE